MDFLVEGMNEEQMKEIVAGRGESSAEAACAGLNCDIAWANVCWEDGIAWTCPGHNERYVWQFNF